MDEDGRLLGGRQRTSSMTWPRTTSSTNLTVSGNGSWISPATNIWVPTIRTRRDVSQSNAKGSALRACGRSDDPVESEAKEQAKQTDHLRDLLSVPVDMGRYGRLLEGGFAGHLDWIIWSEGEGRHGSAARVLAPDPISDHALAGDTSPARPASTRTPQRTRPQGRLARPGQVVLGRPALERPVDAPPTRQPRPGSHDGNSHWRAAAAAATGKEEEEETATSGSPGGRRVVCSTRELGFGAFDRSVRGDSGGGVHLDFVLSSTSTDRPSAVELVFVSCRTIRDDKSGRGKHAGYGERPDCAEGAIRTHESSQHVALALAGRPTASSPRRIWKERPIKISQHETS